MWMKTDHNHASENELVECGILIAMAKKRAREDESASLDQIVYETVSIVENKEKVLEYKKKKYIYDKQCEIFSKILLEVE